MGNVFRDVRDTITRVREIGAYGGDGVEGAPPTTIEVHYFKPTGAMEGGVIPATRWVATSDATDFEIADPEEEAWLLPINGCCYAAGILYACKLIGQNSADGLLVYVPLNPEQRFFARILSRSVETCGTTGSGSGAIDYERWQYRVQEVSLEDGEDAECPSWVAATGGLLVTAYEANNHRIAPGKIVEVRSVLKRVDASGSSPDTAECEYQFLANESYTYQYLCLGSPSRLREYKVWEEGVSQYIRTLPVCCDCTIDSGSGTNPSGSGSGGPGCCDNPPDNICITVDLGACGGEIAANLARQTVSCPPNISCWSWYGTSDGYVFSYDVQYNALTEECIGIASITPEPGGSIFCAFHAFGINDPCEFPKSVTYNGSFYPDVVATVESGTCGATSGSGSGSGGISRTSLGTAVSTGAATELLLENITVAANSHLMVVAGSPDRTMTCNFAGFGMTKLVEYSGTDGTVAIFIKSIVSETTSYISLRATGGAGGLLLAAIEVIGLESSSSTYTDESSGVLPTQPTTDTIFGGGALPDYVQFGYLVKCMDTSFSWVTGTAGQSTNTLYNLQTYTLVEGYTVLDTVSVPSNSELSGFSGTGGWTSTAIRLL